MSVIVITAADSNYFEPLKSLILSLEQNTNGDYARGVLDLGLSSSQIDWLKQRDINVIKPKWDIQFPNQNTTNQHFMAMTARPHLKKYFEGYDYYFWIDADAWVQDKTYFDLYIEGAKTYGFTITPEIDRSYQAFYNGGYTRNWVGNLYLEGWGEELAFKLVEFPIINSGVWCLHADHVIWNRWQTELSRALQRSQNFYIEQTALNVAIYTTEGAAPHFLPSYANWNCGHSNPTYDPVKKSFVEPLLPHKQIGIVHLCGISPKTQMFEVKGTDGVVREMSYLFNPDKGDEY